PGSTSRSPTCEPRAVPHRTPHRDRSVPRRQEGRFPPMSEQTSTPDESYEGLDDSLSFSSSAVDDAAPQAAAAPEVEEASAETADPALEAGGPAESPEAEGESAEAAEDETSEAAGDETTEEPAEDAEAAAEEPAEEDPLVQLKRHLRAAAGDWYVIHSYSG